jgi:hypothetical protein
MKIDQKLGLCLMTAYQVGRPSVAAISRPAQRPRLKVGMQTPALQKIAYFEP